MLKKKTLIELIRTTDAPFLRINRGHNFAVEHLYHSDGFKGTHKAVCWGRVSPRLFHLWCGVNSLEKHSDSRWEVTECCRMSHASSHYNPFLSLQCVYEMKAGLYKSIIPRTNDTYRNHKKNWNSNFLKLNLPLREMFNIVVKQPNIFESQLKSSSKKEADM